jgi:hypothetical protein
MPGNRRDLVGATARFRETSLPQLSAGRASHTAPANRHPQFVRHEIAEAVAREGLRELVDRIGLALPSQAAGTSASAG